MPATYLPLIVWRPRTWLLQSWSRFHPLISFPDQWVVLVDADWADDHNFEFGSAHVFAHRESRGQATKDMGEACRSFENVGCFFTGRIRGPIPRFAVP